MQLLMSTHPRPELRPYVRAYAQRVVGTRASRKQVSTIHHFYFRWRIRFCGGIGRRLTLERWPVEA